MHIPQINNLKTSNFNFDMPADRNQFLRYKVLDRIFKDYNHRYDIDEIINIVSKEVPLADGTRYKYNQSTFRKDKKDLESLIPRGLKVETKSMGDHKKYYRYSNRYQSLFSTTLDSENVEELSIAVRSLSKFRGVAGYEWLDGVLFKIENKLGLPHDDREKELITFDNNEKLNNSDLLNSLIHATVHRRILKLTYKPYDKDEVTWTFHPWHVKQYNNRWFIFGWSDEEEKMVTTAIDRIVTFEEIRGKFHRNDSVDFNTYFKDIVGVTVPHFPKTDVICPTEEIVLKFDPRRFHYVKTKPLHSSQEYDESQFTVTVYVKVNREFITKILSFGSDVQVIKGDFLKKKIIENAQKTLDKYLDNQKVDV